MTESQEKLEIKASNRNRVDSIEHDLMQLTANNGTAMRALDNQLLMAIARLLICLCRTKPDMEPKPEVKARGKK